MNNCNRYELTVGILVYQCIGQLNSRFDPQIGNRIVSNEVKKN